ncbi:hypothetical protein OC846_000461 [Tilletia horrida]|uniref:SET domain-containing protein n=1 Tax=Tilletia horrida TaxID=155126 RepID=A0AAN6GX03_9BASI|nr:hypothetical protein OC846_000461 [Tilletia horrida]KAK0567911.1 hypothetical protein OC861_002471 [Tilletia horrida]
MSTADKALQITDPEVLKLSRWRLYFNRVPDILVNFRKKMERENAVWSEADRRWYSQQFLAYCREHEKTMNLGPGSNFAGRTNTYSPRLPSVATTRTLQAAIATTTSATPQPANVSIGNTTSIRPPGRKIAEPLPMITMVSSPLRYFLIRSSTSATTPAAVLPPAETVTSNTAGEWVWIWYVFKTKARGWGLKATQNVPKGEFVMVYTGELLDIIDAEKRGRAYDQHGIGYLLDLDSWHIKVHCMYKPYNDSRKEKKLQPLDIHGDEISTACSKWFEKANSPTLTVDAGLWGNLSRYLNHSCDPNLTMYPVYYGKRAGYIPQPDIKAGEELTFSYNGEDENNLDDDFDDEEMEEDSEDEDEQRAWAEGVSSQKPGTSAPKGFKTQKQRRKARKVVSASQDEDAKQSELGNLKAQVCRCGAKNCKKYFWS